MIEDQNFDGFSRITDEMYGFTIKNARLSGVYISTIVFFSAVLKPLSPITVWKFLMPTVKVAPPTSLRLL